MRKIRSYLGKGFLLALFISMAVLILPNGAEAYPLTNVVVTWNLPAVNVSFDSGTNYDNYYSDYGLISDQLGTKEAFCVEDAGIGDSPYNYEIIAVPDFLETAALLADQYFQNTATYNKTAMQLAVWEVTFDTDYNFDEGVFRAGNSSYRTTAQSYLDSIQNYQLIGPVGLANSPAGGDPGTPAVSQNYIVSAPVPEPTTILLSGLGLLGMGAYLRRRRSRKI